MAGEPQPDCLFCKIVSGEIPATISIGIGRGAKDLEEAYQFALLGIDMALPWPAVIEPLRALFEKMRASEPFAEEGFTLIEAPLAVPGAERCVIGVSTTASRKPPRKNETIASAPSRLTESHVHSTFMRRANESEPPKRILFTT